MTWSKKCVRLLGGRGTASMSDTRDVYGLTNKMIVKDNMLQIEGFVLVKKIGSGWIGGWVEEPF